ncbi:AfsR/SARP family transcriptional regulator [Arthrobacter sulfonylureivorans]|uniref:AfsR/SARP family transcriptional regulator n=1 Tax=Arthrobacter sulfonylureivorans TaxID=2486855 RepID=UPI0039E665C8
MLRGGIVEQMSGRVMPVSVQMIGNLRITRGNTVLTAEKLGGPKPRQVLEILLLNVGSPMSKDRLVDMLWGGRAPGEALATLESYVSILRRNLQPGCAKSGPLRTANGGYMIDREMVDVDLYRFQRLLRAAEFAAPANAYPLLNDALSLASGPLLGDELTPEWAEEARAAHAEMVQHAQLLAAESALTLGRADEAVLWAQRCIAAAPLNEAAWTALIVGLEQSDRHADGLQAYERCRRIFSDELGCCPGPGLQEVYGRLLHATAESSLSEVLGALMVLNERLAPSANRTSTAHRKASVPLESHYAAAGDIVKTFLTKALMAG